MRHLSNVATFFFALCNLALVQAQIHYSHHFTKEVERCRAEFIEPVEGLYKVKLLRKDDHLKYDLVLFSDDYNFEMRYSLEPRYDRDTPHIDFFTLASSLAINENEVDIHLNLFPPEEALATFNADWAAYADFIPKPSFTEKSYARLVTQYRQGTGLMHTILLFDHHDDEKDRRLYTISFRNDLPE